MSNKSIIFLIAIILSCSCIFASKEWNQIDCENIDAITFDNIGGLQSTSNCYVFSGNPQKEKPYKFNPDKQNSTLEKLIIPPSNFLMYNLLLDGTYLYMFYTDVQGINCIFWGNLLNFSSDFMLYHPESSEDELENGEIFIMDTIVYHLSYNGKLSKVSFSTSSINYTTTSYNGSMNKPQEFTPRVALNNTIYYFSTDGFCSLKISGDTATSEVVSSVAVTDPTSSLVTDNDYRIWIVNSKDGVVEYNAKKNTAKTLTTFPTAKISNRETDFTKACFYSENALYLFTNNKLYYLDVEPENDPDEPQKAHDQSGHTCGCMGLEFLFVFIVLSLLHRNFFISKLK